MYSTCSLSPAKLAVTVSLSLRWVIITPVHTVCAISWTWREGKMDMETLTCTLIPLLGNCHQPEGLMPISNRGQDKRSDIAVHTHTHTHATYIYTPSCSCSASGSGVAPLPRSSPSEGTDLSSDAFTGKVWLPAGPLSPSTGTSWSAVSAGSKGPSVKLVCYCSLVLGILSWSTVVPRSTDTPKS